ncbi:aminotransferase class V-fold PLP-dependent enzyme [Skermania piniformis]|uniref:Aminotransferase class V-fold PLP-dependent enzyme n=1 Tax=Skermania pinensis TaxID=39122 RepID=A0ABX8S4M0_9ACTN|nr:aminotransferase class V-fold PLP-dependent enzyme [Skermania piniformis]QXQ12789.1 aminotransferase class V-fold PLP-dependent enzyme [Skermania piniformis]
MTTLLIDPDVALAVDERVDTTTLRLVDDGLRVPLADSRTCAYANFDYAASAPALERVVDAVRSALPSYASVHRGAGAPSRVTTDRYERARDTIARFFGAAEPGYHVCFTRNTTDALNLLSRCVPGDVVVLEIEHHANFLPWARRRVVPVAATRSDTLAALEQELSARPAALLAVTGASNVTGEVLPIGELARLAHRHGARILIDAAQLAPHRRIDLCASGIDYLVASGHKLYAPFGTGVLIGRADWLDAAPPYLAGGGASAAVTRSGVDWHTGPARHEGGTPNVLGAIAFAAACEVLAATDRGALVRDEQTLTDRLRRGLESIDGLRTLRIWHDDGDVVGIVSFVVAGCDPAAVAELLSNEFGVGVRAGKFCAHPLLAALGCSDGAVRASIGLGTTIDDIDRLIAGVRCAVTDPRCARRTRSQ